LRGTRYPFPLATQLHRPSGLGVEDVNARRAQTRHQQVAALDVRMGRVRAQRRAAGVPAVVMQFVADVRDLGAANHLAEGGRAGVNVNHAQGVVPPVGGIGIEGYDVGEASRGARIAMRADG
jgi:hypothetical protein